MAFLVFGVMQASDYGWLQARQDWVVAGRRVLIPQGGISPVMAARRRRPRRVLAVLPAHPESRAGGKEPLVHLRVLRSGLTNIGLITQNIQWFVLLGSSFVLAVYFQVARANSAIETGLLMTPATIGVLIASARIQNIVKRRPGRQVLVLGFGVAAVGIVLMLLAAMLSANDWALAPGLFIFGLGMGAILPASVTLVQSSMPRKTRARSRVSPAASRILARRSGPPWLAP